VDRRDWDGGGRVTMKHVNVPVSDEQHAQVVELLKAMRMSHDDDAVAAVLYGAMCIGLAAMTAHNVVIGSLKLMAEGKGQGQK
jgi:hypothetical protein